MPEYEHTLTIAASPEKVFAFVTDVANMPKYLNTVKSAESQGEGRVAMTGEVKGEEYASDGWLEIEQSPMKMSWGSDGENDYEGWLTVTGSGDSSDITVHLSFEPNEGMEQKFEEQMGSRDAVIKSGIKTSLESVKNHIEGTGGKVASPVDTEATLNAGR